jgi:hypothetical protein
VAPDRVDLDASAADVRVPAGETWVIDTGAGSIVVHEGDPTGDPVRQIDLGAQGIVYRVVPQDGGASLGVFAVGRLTIAEGARVVSIGDLPLVLLAGTEAVIEGELSVAANEVTGDEPGAGGYRGAPAQGSFETMPGEGPGGGGTGEKLHGTETFVDAGGGGGSFGGPGGAGGAGEGSSETAAGGAPGPVDPDRTLDPLSGGSGGGAGAGNPGGAGGHGGGALQLSARDRVRVAPTGSVNAGGGGGRSPAMRSAGGGGGSGGAILLEAPVVEILGSVAAMGGGGGQGGADVASDHGENGRTDGVRARGGDNGMCCGPGGAGSDPVFGAATDGRAGQNAGGGGGGGGRVRILTATGMETYAGVYPDEERGPSSVAPITSAR